MGRIPRHHSDAELDPSFDRFVERSSPALLRAGFLLVGNQDDAEDLLQLTLLRTARRWDRARSAPAAYARQVLINLSRDRRRYARRRVDEQPLDTADRASLPDLAPTVLTRATVLAALKQLPARQREVVVLRFYSELSVEETAAAMGASTGTVKSYTARAMDRLRLLLADESPSLRSCEVPR